MDNETTKTTKKSKTNILDNPQDYNFSDAFELANPGLWLVAFVLSAIMGLIMTPIVGILGFLLAVPFLLAKQNLLDELYEKNNGGNKEENNDETNVE